MDIDFDNKWFRETCSSGGLDPDNELSKSAVDLARDKAIEMKKYMDAKEQYQDEEILRKLDENINRLNNERIGHMLDAVAYAEVMGGLGDGFNEFAKRIIDRRKYITSSNNDVSSNLSPVEKRVNDRWEQAMSRRAGVMV